MIFSCDSTALTSCSLLQRNVRAPTRSPGKRERNQPYQSWTPMTKKSSSMAEDCIVDEVAFFIELTGSVSKHI